MVESVERELGSFSGVAAAVRRTASSWTDRLPAARQKRTELTFVGLLVILYGLAGATFEPTLIAQPSELVTHMLMLLGAAVIFLGLWDTLSALALRHLLRRDKEALWRNYGLPRDLQRRLDNSTFELNAEIGGGLLAATLRRFTALERPESNFVACHLTETIRFSRIGMASLTYAAIAAPVLGVLAAAAELRVSLSTQGASPSSEAALGIFILGLTISLLALLFTRLLGASLAEDCAFLLAPVIEAARGLTRRKKSRADAESDGEAAFAKRVLVWTASPWSQELSRLRTAGAIVSWLVTAVLIVLVSLPGGFVDQWLGG